MKIVSIKWLPCLFIILSFQLLDSLSTGADLNYKNYLTTLIQNTINHEDQSRLASMIESLRAKHALNDFDECYDPRYRNQTMDLFNGNFNVNKIIENYYIEEQERVQKLSSTSLKQKVKTLLENIETIIKEVETCLSGPVDQRTKVGFTSLTDWTIAEFRRLLNFKLPDHATLNNNIRSAEILSGAAKAAIPDEFDWRKKGYVGPIKNQFTCFCCFIFAAVSNVETAYMIQKQTPYDQCQIDLSEQAILDCMDDPNTCSKGGFPLDVWKKMQEFDIYDEKAYPYTDHQNKDNCSRAPPNKWGIKIRDSFQNVSLVDDKYLQNLVMQHGAVAVAIKSTLMQNLHGKFNKDCPGEDAVDHAVTLIGWDKDYWIIKNSWGTNWGIDGFLYLKRGGDRCGIQEMQASAILAQ